MFARDALSSLLTTCPTCNRSRITHLSFAADCRKLISGCKSCGLVFLNPLPMAREIAARYAPGGSWSRKVVKRKGGREARRALKKVQRDQDAPKPWIVTAAAALYKKGARDVVDVGCEEGKLLDRLQTRGWNTFGVDPNTKDTIVRHKMLSALPEEPCFDLVIMDHVLEHLPDPLAAMRAVKQEFGDP